MTIQLAARYRPLVNRSFILALALILFGALLMIAVYLAPLYEGVASTSAATSSEAPISQRLAVPAEAPRSTCAVTGDLAGDANPAEIAAILCGAERR